MQTKINCLNDIISFVTDEINFYVENGYTINPKSSVLRNTSKSDCIFKSALAKMTDDVKHEIIFTISSCNNDRECDYHKIEIVNDSLKVNEVHSYVFDITSKSDEDKSIENNSTSGYECIYNQQNWNNFSFKNLELLVQKYAGKDWNSDQNISNALEQLKTSIINHMNNADCLSACDRLDAHASSKDECTTDSTVDKSTDHIVVDHNDSAKDIYNKIVDHRMNSTNSNNLDDTTDEDVDDIEDSLIKVVRYIFGR